MGQQMGVGQKKLVKSIDLGFSMFLKYKWKPNNVK